MPTYPAFCNIFKDELISIGSYVTLIDGGLNNLSGKKFYTPSAQALSDNIHLSRKEMRKNS